MRFLSASFMVLWAGLAGSCAPRTPAAAPAGKVTPEAGGNKARQARRRPQPPRFVHIDALRDAALLPARVKAADGECDELCKEYELAVVATKYPEPGNISRQLTALVPATQGLIWNAQGQILMSTWTHIGKFPNQPGETITLQGDSWWTAASVMQDFCRDTGLQGNELNIRIAQRLGMPATSTNDGFVQVWIDPQYIFRPCPDPEIDDHECQVQVSMVPPFKRTDNEPPWACSGTQRSEEFVAVNQSHLQWMCANWTGSFTNPDLENDYPWTALGYTYDWGQADHVGPSEFVTLDGTQAVFESAIATDIYCAPQQ